MKKKDSFIFIPRDKKIPIWDVWNSKRRIFRIRGNDKWNGPEFVIFDERQSVLPKDNGRITFGTLSEGVSYITKLLMK